LLTAATHLIDSGRISGTYHARRTVAMTAPVGQNQIHINLINYKHHCMRQFFGEFFGESLEWPTIIYYNKLEVKISVFSTTFRS